MKPYKLISAAKQRYRKGGLSALFRYTYIFLFGSVVVAISVEDISNSLIQKSKLRNGVFDIPYIEFYSDDSDFLPNLTYETMPLQDNEFVFHEYSHVFDFEPQFVVELTDAVIIGPHAAVIDENGLVTTDAVINDTDRVRWMLHNAAVSEPHYVWNKLKGKSCDTEQTVPVGAVFYHQTGNYYHWVIEQILKLRAVEQYEAKTGQTVSLILPSQTPQYVYECLDLLGYDADRLVKWNGSPLTVERCIVPSEPEPTPKALAWFRNRVADSVDQTWQGSSRLYVSRQRAERGRRVVNYEEVAEVLESYDIEPIYGEELSAAEQIAAFQDAELIVGPHGAGLTNMIWAEDTAVLELHNSVVKGPFYLLAAIQGHQYEALAGTPVGKPRQPINADISVDVTELKHKLESLLD